MKPIGVWMLNVVMACPSTRGALARDVRAVALGQACVCARNVSYFVAPQHWRKPWASPHRCSAHRGPRGAPQGSVANYRKQESLVSQAIDFPIHDFRILPRKGNFATELSQIRRPADCRGTMGTLIRRGDAVCSRSNKLSMNGVDFGSVVALA